MQSTENKKPEQNFHGSAVSYPLWWSSASSFMPQYTPFTHSLNLNLDAFPEKHQHVNQLGRHYEDQDSPSSQSTSQSQHNSGSTEIEPLKTNVEPADNSKQMLSIGNGDFLYPAIQPNSSQSVIHIPYYGDPFYSSMLAAYGPQPQVQTQLYGMTPRRVPLPDAPEAEPIYVNAKQYHGIMRRRELRAKQEAQNKLVKARKPYLHESRHRHAMNRARGTGGRFLNTKKSQDSETASDEGETAEKQSNPENLQRENKGNTSSSTCSSTDSGIPDGKSDMVFGTYQSVKAGNLYPGGQPRVPVMR